MVNVNWNQAIKMCEWLSKVTDKEWRLPTNAEWEAAVGISNYPWGDYFPPHWDDGNYAILADGKDDPKKIGVDGILRTAPVGSFKLNALGFYDLGGHAIEWMVDGFDAKDPKANRVLRGGSWNGYARGARTATNTPRRTRTTTAASAWPEGVSSLAKQAAVYGGAGTARRAEAEWANRGSGRTGVASRENASFPGRFTAAHAKYTLPVSPATEVPSQSSLVCTPAGRSASLTRRSLLYRRFEIL